MHQKALSVCGEAFDTDAVRRPSSVGRQDGRQAVFEANMDPVRPDRDKSVAGEDGQHHGADREQAVRALDQLPDNWDRKAVLMPAQRMDAAVDE